MSKIKYKPIFVNAEQAALIRYALYTVFEVGLTAEEKIDASMIIDQCSEVRRQLTGEEDE